MELFCCFRVREKWDRARASSLYPTAAGIIRTRPDSSNRFHHNAALQSELVPTQLRGHHSDVVPSDAFSVQRLCGPYDSTAFIDPEVPFVFFFTVQEIPAGRGNHDPCVHPGCIFPSNKYKIVKISVNELSAVWWRPVSRSKDATKDQTGLNLLEKCRSCMDSVFT